MEFLAIALVIVALGAFVLSRRSDAR